MATIGPIVPGLPGFRSAVTSTPRHVMLGGDAAYIAVNAIIDGTKTRDSGNTGDTDRLRPGLLMGKVTSGGKYSNSVIGQSQAALTATGTTLTTNAAIGTELNRRIGASGTFKLTGPPTASGTVRTVTVTYSAVNVSTGDVTITALGVNDVQTLNFTNSPAGTFRLGIVDSSGVLQYTQRITYSATIATLLANLQAATDAVLATNAIVWSGSVVTAVAGTFSGTGYAALPQTLIVVDADALTAGDVDVTHTTTGVDGRFVTKSLIQPTDGSETILTFIPGDYPMTVTDETGTSQDQPFPKVCVSGMVDTAQIVDYPADASLKTYVKQALSTAVGGKFAFSDTF